MLRSTMEVFTYHGFAEKKRDGDPTGEEDKQRGSMDISDL